VQELIPSDARNKEIDAPVVVVVAGRCAHGVPDAGDAGRLGDVREAQAAVVAEETVGVGASRLLERRHLRAVGEKDVWPAVAVVVEDGQAARHAVDIELARRRRAAVVNETQGGLTGEVSKSRMRGFRRRTLCRDQRDHAGRDAA
jgi:hypothetical protein